MWSLESHSPFGVKSFSAPGARLDRLELALVVKKE
jgi:hypothetical protein